MEEQTYLKVMDEASKWNGLLLRDRSDRLPFFDAQTGISQIDCRQLWHKESERFPGQRLGQVFSYPAARWKWIRRPNPSLEESVAVDPAGDLSNDFESLGRVPGGETGKGNVGDWSQSELDHFFHGEEDFPEPEEEEDDDYYDDTYRKRRRKVGVSPAGGYSNRRGGRRQPTEEDAMKPFVCDTCGLGYKTKPGLHYHLMKAHPAAAVAAPPPNELVRPRLPSNICDVCRQEVLPNIKTGQPENLIVCADCGKAGHPTCLQFNDNMIFSVSKYKWQCMDCKTCALCGTSENDDVLLFCDDCDRGYHMYCLNPPISEPPEGSWSCQLCLAEFHENAASARNAETTTTAAASSSANNAGTDSSRPPSSSRQTTDETIESGSGKADEKDESKLPVSESEKNQSLSNSQVPSLEKKEESVSQLSSELADSS